MTTRYLYGPTVDFILARRNASGTVAWYLADHMGSIRDLVNTSGTVQDHINYSAYGKVTAESQPSNGDRFKFTGREYDSETADHYYRARYHDGATGRFISLDPITFSGGDPNLYRYVRNDPTKGNDPLGQSGGDVPWYRDNGWDWFNPWTYPGLRILPNWMGGYGPPPPDTPIRPAVGPSGEIPNGPLTTGTIGTYWGCSYSQAGECAAVYFDEIANRGTAAAMAAVIPAKFTGKTAEQIIGEYKAASINRVFPSQYKKWIIEKIAEEAKKGVDAARTAMKLLIGNKYNK